MAARQARDLHHQRESHDFITEQLASADRVREDQVALQLLQLGVGNARFREPAESGVDAVGRVTLCNNALDRLRRSFNRGRVGSESAESGDIHTRRSSASCKRPGSMVIAVARHRFNRHRQLKPLRRAQAIALRNPRPHGA